MLIIVECGSSAVECRTFNREKPLLLPFRSFILLSTTPSSLRCINEYLAIDSGRNVSETSLCAVTVTWQNSSERNQVGAGTNRSICQVVKCALSGPNV